MSQGLGLSGRVAKSFLQSEITPLLALVGLLLGVFAVLITPREEEPQINVTFANIFIPFPGASAREVEHLVASPAEQVMSELEGVKRRARANFIRGLRGNNGMASQLAWYQTYTGDWRNLFDEVAEIEAVTLDDVKRVAAEVFTVKNRTVAIIETEEDES